MNRICLISFVTIDQVLPKIEIVLVQMALNELNLEEIIKKSVKSKKGVCFNFLFLFWMNVFCTNLFSVEKK